MNDDSQSEEFENNPAATEPEAGQQYLRPTETARRALAKEWLRVARGLPPTEDAR